MDFLKKLRIKNIERQQVWPGAEKVDEVFRGLELGEEAGELQGAIKKLYRARRKIAGNAGKSYEDLYANLREEIGDVLITLDLVAMQYELSIQDCVVEKFNATSTKNDLEVFLD